MRYQGLPRGSGIRANLQEVLSGNLDADGQDGDAPQEIELADSVRVCQNILENYERGQKMIEAARKAREAE